jgi:hypothetical protein
MEALISLISSKIDIVFLIDCNHIQKSIIYNISKKLNQNLEKTVSNNATVFRV